MRQNREAPLPPAGRSFAALVRTDYVTRTIPLTEPQYLFLEAMAGGGGVDGAAEAVARHLGDDGREAVRDPGGLSGQRRRWIDWGFFIAG